MLQKMWTLISVDSNELQTKAQYTPLKFKEELCKQLVDITDYRLLVPVRTCVRAL